MRVGDGVVQRDGEHVVVGRKPHHRDAKERSRCEIERRRHPRARQPARRRHTRLRLEIAEVEVLETLRWPASDDRAPAAVRPPECRPQAVVTLAHREHGILERFEHERTAQPQRQRDVKQ